MVGSRLAMEVQCDSCKTEYEFDDALVSVRGTRVRCTHCGHQFTVRRSEATERTDEWVILTSKGDELRFGALRDLQRAILDGRVARSDLFVVGGAEPRALGSVFELEPFFDGRVLSSSPPPQASRAPIRIPRNAPVPVIANERSNEKEDVPYAAGPQLPASTDAALGEDVAEPPTQRRLPESEGRNTGRVSSEVENFRSRAQTGDSVPPPPRSPPASGEPTPESDPVTRRVLDAMASRPAPASRSASAISNAESRSSPRGERVSAADDSRSIVRRRRVGGWVVGATLLVALSAIGWRAARLHVLRDSHPSVSPGDVRASALAADSERALMDGDLDTAEKDVESAMGLSDHNSRIIRDRSRVAAAKSDIPWLALKVLPPSALAERLAATDQLSSTVAVAKKAALDAYAIDPGDPANACALVNALRLEGDAGSARNLVSKISDRGEDPEFAYVVALLDLTEPVPIWSTVIERLRIATAAEGRSGRARAALVYALGRWGDRVSAATELAQLDSLNRQYPLSPYLRAWIEGLPRLPVASLSRGALVSSRETPSALGVAPQEAGLGTGVPGDAVSAMQLAATALRDGDYARAGEIYGSLVARNEHDSEALSGLGDVAHARGDVSGAIAAYRRAIGINPSYLPALVGVADVEWASGDRVSARAAYENVVDHFPEGAYPSYVKNRAEEPVEVTPAKIDATTAQAGGSESDAGHVGEPTTGDFDR